MKRKELIKSRGNKTQEEVAMELGITQKHLSKIELGHRNPSLGLAAKIATFYKVPVDKLFKDIFLSKDTPKRSLDDKYTT